MIPLIIIEGPTASGKTDLAVKTAQMIGGEVVSADSMQIYKYMDIGSAKPTEEEMCGVPHHLISIAEPTENFSLHEYVPAAHKAIADIAKRGKIPVMAGGTGLYIDTVKNNIILTNEKDDPSVRKKYEDFYEKNGVDELHRLLCEKDPVSAEKIHKNNVKRVIRALEVNELAGMSMTDAQEKSRTGEKIYDVFEFAIDYDREVLYDRINRRVDIMFDKGLLEEVEYCIGLGCTRKNTSMQAIGYKEILDYFDGFCTLDESKEKIKTESRRYAKRQLTWFRRSNITWLSPGESIEPYMAEIDFKKYFN